MSLERRMPVPDPVRFATFLVKYGTVTEDRALEGLGKQRDGRPALGRVAVETGLVTVAKLQDMLDRWSRERGSARRRFAWGSSPRTTWAGC